MAIEIRLLQEDEIELANNFFNAIYKVNRSIDNFRWEFLEGPCGKAIYVIAIDDSVTQYKKIIGIQCAIPMELINANGDVLLSAKSEDTLVDPAYRGQKVFERMYDLLFEECKKAGVKYIWGFTPAKKAFERIGFEIPFQANQALMVFRSTKAYSYLSILNPQNRFIDKMKIAGLVFLSRIDSLRRYAIAPQQLIVKQLPIQSKSEVVKKLVASSPLYFLNMTEKYMTWRMSKNPFNNHYENYQFFNGDKLLADVIVNLRQPDLGYLEQLIFTDGISSQLRKSVIVHTVQLMKRKVSLIRVICFDINEELQQQEELFKQCGFFLIKRGGYFVWKALTSIDFNPKNLFMTRLFTQGNQ